MMSTTHLARFRRSYRIDRSEVSTYGNKVALRVAIVTYRWHRDCVLRQVGSHYQTEWREEGHMDAIRLLTDDHREVKELFHEYESAGERAHKRKQRIVEQVFHALQAHTRVEEEIFYPAVQAKADHEGEELVAESRQEHHVVDVLMSEMQTLEPDNPEYEAKFKVLMDNVEH